MELEPLGKLALWKLLGIGLFGLTALIFGASTLGGTWRAGQYVGTLGTFSAERHTCTGRGYCYREGQFDSDDGTLHLSNVSMDGDLNGRSVRAIAPSRRASEVYKPGGWAAFVWSIGITTLGAFAIAVAGYGLLVRRRADIKPLGRRPRAAGH